MSSCRVRASPQGFCCTKGARARSRRPSSFHFTPPRSLFNATLDTHLRVLVHGTPFITAVPHANTNRRRRSPRTHRTRVLHHAPQPTPHANGFRSPLLPTLHALECERARRRCLRQNSLSQDRRRQTRPPVSYALAILDLGHDDNTHAAVVSRSRTSSSTSRSTPTPRPVRRTGTQPC